MPFGNLNVKQDTPAAGGEIISYKHNFSHAPLILVNANRVYLEQVLKKNTVCVVETARLTFAEPETISKNTSYYLHPAGDLPFLG